MRILLVDERFDSSTIIADWLSEFFGAVWVELAARMPVMNGVEFAELIKARPNPPVVVVIDAGNEGELETQCMAAGADFWVEKRHLQARLLAFLQQRFSQAWAEGVLARRTSAISLMCVRRA